MHYHNHYSGKFALLRDYLLILPGLILNLYSIQTNFRFGSTASYSQSCLNHLTPFCTWPIYYFAITFIILVEESPCSCFPTLFINRSMASSPFPSWINDMTATRSMQFYSVSCIDLVNPIITGRLPYGYPSVSNLSDNNVKWLPYQTAILQQSYLKAALNLSGTTSENLKQVSTQEENALNSICASACNMATFYLIRWLAMNYLMPFALSGLRKGGYLNSYNCLQGIFLSFENSDILQRMSWWLNMCE